MAIEKGLQSEFEEESYVAMDSVIMDIGINQLIKEHEDDKLSDIVNALQSVHCIKSMSLSESQKIVSSHAISGRRHQLLNNRMSRIV